MAIIKIAMIKICENKKIFSSEKSVFSWIFSEAKMINRHEETIIKECKIFLFILLLR